MDQADPPRPFCHHDTVAVHQLVLRLAIAGQLSAGALSVAEDDLHPTVGVDDDGSITQGVGADGNQDDGVERRMKDGTAP